MSTILDKYGIKEVADVTFYDIKTNAPVLYLDTLKVSNIEITAETAEAKGGKGNAALISWDYGKEITVTLEDALFSTKSLALMYGSKIFTGEINIYKTVPVLINVNNDEEKYIETKWYDKDGEHSVPTSSHFYPVDPTEKEEMTKDFLTLSETKKEHCYFATFERTIKKVNGTPLIESIDISANKFPGVYKVIGDTYARSETTGEDEYFQFIIPKAKVLSENTLTLEAEGDPTVFNLNLKVLRPEDGNMMKLIKYIPSGTTGGDSGSGGSSEDTSWEIKVPATINNNTVLASPSSGTTITSSTIKISCADGYTPSNPTFNGDPVTLIQNTLLTNQYNVVVTPTAGTNTFLVSFIDSGAVTPTD